MSTDSTRARLPAMATLPSTSALTAVCSSCALRPATTSSLRSGLAGLGMRLTVGPAIAARFRPAGMACGVTKAMASLPAGAVRATGKRASRQAASAPSHDAATPAARSVAPSAPAGSTNGTVTRRLSRRSKNGAGSSARLSGSVTREVLSVSVVAGLMSAHRLECSGSSQWSSV
ncbi:hypothetical protein D9M68_592490 [compost metagenome]